MGSSPQAVGVRDPREQLLKGGVSQQNCGTLTGEEREKMTHDQAEMCLFLDLLV